MYQTAYQPPTCIGCGTILPNRRGLRCPDCALSWRRLQDRIRKGFVKKAKAAKAAKVGKLARVTRTCQRCQGKFTASAKGNRQVCSACSQYAGTTCDPIFTPGLPTRPSQTPPGRPEDCSMTMVKPGRSELTCMGCTRTDCRIAVYRARALAGQAIFHPDDGQAS